MLRHRDGVAEPADVAEIGEDRRRARRVEETACQLGAEKVLVANVRGDALAADRKRRRIQRAARKVAQRNVHQLGEPAEAGRDELAEGHQVHLVVAVGRAAPAGGRQPDHRVGVAGVDVAQRHAEQQRARRILEARAQSRPVVGQQFGQLLRQKRHRRLRRHHQLAARLAQRMGHPGQRLRHVVHRELLVLRHIALQQADAQLADRAAEFACAPGRRKGRHGERHRGADQRMPRAAALMPGGAEQAADHGCQQPDAAGADPRRPGGQRAVDLRVAAGQPGKAGEDDGARQFGQQPHGGEQRHVDGDAAAAPACEQRQRQRQVQRQRHAQQHYRQRRHPGRQAAVAMQADEEPPHARPQPGATE